MITNFDSLYKNLEPELGMPCTVCYLSDSHPARIVGWKRNRDNKVTHVQAQLDDWKIIKGSEQDGSAEYVYTENTSNPCAWYRLRKNGRWVRQGMSLNDTPSLSIGHKRRYYDPHF